jgi:hypothetical protein
MKGVWGERKKMDDGCLFEVGGVRRLYYRDVNCFPFSREEIVNFEKGYIHINLALPKKIYTY